MKTEHVSQGILEHNTETTRAGCSVISVKSYHKDGVFGTRFLAFVLAGQPLPNPPHRNPFATLSGVLDLKFTHRVIAVGEVLFGEKKKKSKKMTSCFPKPQLCFSTLTQYRDVLLPDLEAAALDKNTRDACSRSRAVSPVCQIVIIW